MLSCRQWPHLPVYSYTIAHLPCLAVYNDPTSLFNSKINMMSFQGAPALQKRAQTTPTWSPVFLGLSPFLLPLSLSPLFPFCLSVLLPLSTLLSPSLCVSVFSSFPASPCQIQGPGGCTEYINKREMLKILNWNFGRKRLRTSICSVESLANRMDQV